MLQEYHIPTKNKKKTNITATHTNKRLRKYFLNKICAKILIIVFLSIVMYAHKY